MNGLRRTVLHIRRKTGLDKNLNRKIEKIEKEFSRRTYGVDNFWDLSDFFMLMELAEYGNLGKSKSIIYAFKIGWLAGKWDLKDHILNHFKQSEVAENE